VKDVDVPELDPGRFEGVLDPQQCRRFVRRLEQAADWFGGRRLWHVNSTEQGGGVAEMLHFLLGYLRGAGIDSRWAVLEGNEDFLSGHQARSPPAPRPAGGRPRPGPDRTGRLGPARGGQADPGPGYLGLSAGTLTVRGELHAARKASGPWTTVSSLGAAADRRGPQDRPSIGRPLP
jgi:hypothetical protein